MVYDKNLVKRDLKRLDLITESNRMNPGVLFRRFLEPIGCARGDHASIVQVALAGKRENAENGQEFLPRVLFRVFQRVRVIIFTLLTPATTAQQQQQSQIIKEQRTLPWPSTNPTFYSKGPLTPRS